MKNIVLITALALTSFASAAHARDPFIGEYSGDCGKKAQCWIGINKKGKNYTVDFIVTDRFNDQDVFCKVSGKFERGNINYGMHERYNDGLSGEMNGSITYIAPVSDSSLILGGGLTAGLACDKYIMQQIYEIYGN